MSTPLAGSAMSAFMAPIAARLPIAADAAWELLAGDLMAALLALAGGHEVLGAGIDFEAIRPVRPEALRFFLTRRERAQVDPADALRLWTVKEALFKADPDNASALLVDFETADPAAITGWARHCRRSGARFGYTSLATGDGIVSAALLLLPEAKV